MLKRGYKMSLQHSSLSEKRKEMCVYIYIYIKLYDKLSTVEIQVASYKNAKSLTF